MISRIVVRVDVSCREDPVRAECCLVQAVSNAVAECDSLQAAPAPAVVPEDSVTDVFRFAIICYVRSLLDVQAGQRALCRNILRRFQAEGLESPVSMGVIDGSLTRPA